MSKPLSEQNSALYAKVWKGPALGTNPDFFGNLDRLIDAARESGGVARLPSADQLAAAIDEADATFGYSINLTRLVDGESTYTLTLPGVDGFQEFSSHADASAEVQQFKNRLRADAILPLFQIGDLADTIRHLRNEREILFQEIGALREQAKALEADKARLDFLDEANRRLNAVYGTSYRWKLVMNHNVNRLMLGHQDVDLEDSQPNGLRSCRLAIDERMREAGRATWEGPLPDDLRPMSKALKNGKPVLARFKSEIEHPGADGLAGRWVVIRHPGVGEDDFDVGWNLAGPFGQGGMPDDWFVGWSPLPSDHPPSDLNPSA